MADFDGESNPFDERGKKDEATGGDDSDETTRKKSLDGYLRIFGHWYYSAFGWLMIT